MMHAPFGTLDTMLSVDEMSAREGRTVTRVDVEPWAPDPWHAISGCRFLKVRSTATDGRRHYVVKRTSFATDLIRRLTDDRDCRELLLWEHGILDRLPLRVQTPTVAWARDGDGWALLMYDVSAYIDRLERRDGDTWRVMSWTQTTTIVDALVSIHAEFYRDPILCDPSLGLFAAYKLFAWTRPATLEREGPAAAPFVQAHRIGWSMLERLESPDVVATLGALRANPTPLLDALARYPATLVHGDPRRENMGLTGDDPPRLVLIDWQLTAALPPSVDLAWMLLCCQPFDGSRERVIDYYHDQLVRRLGDRFDDSGWEPQLRLALLGQAVRVMGSMLWMAYESPDVLDRERLREQIPWLCEQVRAGSAYL